MIVLIAMQFSSSRGQSLQAAGCLSNGIFRLPVGKLIACKIEEVQSAGGERGGSSQPEATLEIFRFAFDFIFAASLIYARVCV